WRRTAPRLLSGRAVHHRFAIAVALLLALPAGAQSEAPKPVPLPQGSGEASSERQVKNRLILFSDENRAFVPELHLAQGIPTTVILPVNINEAATRLADPQRLIYK